MEYVKVINVGDSYTTHPQAANYGCINYQQNTQPMIDKVYKVIRSVVINEHLGNGLASAGFSIDYDGLHFLINRNGVVESTKEEYEAQFQQEENNLNNNQIESKMKVKCINVRNFRNLTLNQEYEVVEQSVDFYHVVNNNGTTARYSKEYFEVIEEVEPVAELPIEDEVGVVENEISFEFDDETIEVLINNEVKVKFYCNLIAGNCGTYSISGVNEAYRVFGEDLFPEVMNELMKFLAGETNKGCIIFSTNTNGNEDVVNWLNENSTGKIGEFYNPNSDNPVDMWWFLINQDEEGEEVFEW